MLLVADQPLAAQGGGAVILKSLLGDLLGNGICWASPAQKEDDPAARAAAERYANQRVAGLTNGDATTLKAWISVLERAGRPRAETTDKPLAAAPDRARSTLCLLCRHNVTRRHSGPRHIDVVLAEQPQRHKPASPPRPRVTLGHSPPV